MSAPGNNAAPLVEYLLRLGDDALVLGHRLSEWCGHAPLLEEDLALANIALDCLGQASALLGLAAKLEARGRTADDLVYFRQPAEYRNFLLAELPTKGDFGLTIARQFLFDSYRYFLFQRLTASANPDVAAIAARALKEITYHFRHSSSWVIRLGDGTQESAGRIRRAFEQLWPAVGELFRTDELEELLAKSGVVCSRPSIADKWRHSVAEVFKQAKLTVPEIPAPPCEEAGWEGKHTKHLELMLNEMQSLARAHPGAEW